MQSAPTIGVIHTSPATVELFGRLLRERLPGSRVINVLDDSVLPELRENGGDLASVEPRWRDYARIVSERGVDVVLNACSSIGELCERVQANISQPIVRVDAAMAREAVGRGSRIGVVATLSTTLRPTGDLILHTAQAQGTSIVLDNVLVEGAYAALVGGDQARHDDLVAEALDRATRGNDAVVLAQASMARVLSRLPEDQRVKVLASPAFAVEEVAQYIEGRGSAS
jgi:Asp/Glu/hydantoin racemase